MNNKHLLAFAVLTTVMSPHITSAVSTTVLINNSQAQGANATLPSPPGTVSYNSTMPTLRNNAGTGTSGSAGKAWIQFNLSNTWAIYGQSRLTNATLTIWNLNGPGRLFDLAGLVDNSGLEGWTPAGLNWANAPGNVTNSGYLFNSILIYGGADLWHFNGGGLSDTNATYTQSAIYTSPDISPFLLSDTDGKVTFMLSGSSANNNQSIVIGVPGSFTANPAAGSPLLTLMFDGTPDLTTPVPVFTNVVRSGTNLVLQGKHGPAYGVYQMLRTTNLTISITNWLGIGVKSFDTNGNFNFTNTAPNSAANFFSLQVVSTVPMLAPGITVQPQSLALTTGDGALLSVTATGSDPLTYSWYFNTNTLLSSGNSATLFIPNAQITNSGKYSVTVSNILGTTNSVFATLTITNSTVPPTITTQPLNLTANVGKTANFYAAVNGALPLHYQWYFNTNTVLIGQTNAALTLSNVQTTNAGQYSYVATNLFGVTNSTFATLTINPANSAPDFSLIGWAAVNGGTTGGAGGSTQTVSTASAFNTAVTSGSKMVVQVSGTIDISSISTVNVAANKTIVGLGTNATLIGNLGIYGATNVIVQNLHLINPVITPPNGGVGNSDGLTIQYAQNVWVDHCTFSDCADGSCDITHACDFITVSYCKFYYTTNHTHDFVSLVGQSDANAAEDSGHLRITFHHNWFSTLCQERMPRVRFGQVHVFNNYYGSATSDYAIGVGNYSQIKLESCYFENQSTPWRNQSDTVNYPAAALGTIGWNADNVFVNSPIPTWAINSPQFTPPYSYALDGGSGVKTIVTNYAGTGAGPFAP